MSRSTISRPLTLVGALGLAAALAGCATGGGSAGCAGTDATGSMPWNESYQAVSAAAVSLEDGLAYTIFLADYPTSAEDVSVLGFNPAAPGKGHAILALTAYDAPADLPRIAVGDTITFTEDFGTRTMSLIGEDSEQVLYGYYEGASGTVVITALDDDRICGTIEYSDEEKSLSGTFEAPIGVRF